MLEIWNNFINSADSFFGFLKNLISGFTANIEGCLNVLVNCAAYIILASFLLLLAYNIFIGKSDSIKHINKLKTLVICGLLIALNCVLAIYSLDIGGYLKIGFGFVTIPAVSLMFGPITGCIVGMVQDIVSFIVRPTGAYLPMFTIIPGISGMIYGMFFYKKKITFGKVFLAKLIITVFVNILLNSIAMAPIMSKGIAYYLPARIVKNLVALPFETIILYYFLKAVRKVKL